MKKACVKAKQLIAGSLASIILVQSCTKPSVSYYFSEDIDVINAQNNDYEKNMLLPIEINVDTQLEAYLDFLNDLSCSIIQDPKVAQEFVSDPSLYLYLHGYSNVNVNMDEALLNMVLCMADEELNLSIKNNDVASFIHICNTKGYIKAVKNSDIEIVKKLIISNTELVKQIKELGDMKGETASVVAFAVAAVVGAVVFVWAVAVTHVGAANVALAGTAFVWAAATTYTWKTNGGDPDPEQPPVDKSSVGYTQSSNELIRLWLLKGGDSSRCEMITNIGNEIYVDQLIGAIQNELPEIAEIVDINNLKRNIMLNINMLRYGGGKQ